jgi:RNA polymerase sigma-70 factor, ECF subfamily
MPAGLARTRFVSHSERVASLRLAQERGALAAVPTIGRADRAAARTASPDAHAEALYERLYDRVYGYCLYHLGSREEAEDATQMTFFHALRGLRRGVVPRVETAWVFAIAKNVCLERHQSRGRRRDREVLLEPAALESTPAGGEGQSEDVARLREALTRISKQQREAVLLREWRGFSYREIAAEMGLSLAAVETLIFRARRSLVQHLTDEPNSTQARLAHGFAFGPLAAALKSALAGSAAKIVLTAAALAAAGALAGGALVAADEPADTPRPPAAVTPTDVPPAPEPLFFRPAAAIDSPAPQADADSGSPPAREMKKSPSKSGPQETPLGTVGKQAGDLVEQAGGLVEQTTAVLEPVVEPVQSTLAPVLQTAAVLPELQLPSLDTQLP